MKTLSDLKVGEFGVIKSFTDEFISLKVLDMGCLPGMTVKLLHIALFGDPICIQVQGNILALRQAEASTIVIED